MQKCLRRIFYLIIFLLVLLLLSLFSLARSNEGSAWLVEKLTTPFAKNLSYQGFQGRLLDHFALSNLHLHAKDFDLTFAKVDVQWQIWRLLALHISCDQLLVDHATINIFHSSDTQAPLGKLKLPWWLNAVDVQTFQITQFYFHQKQQRLAFNDLNANIHLDRQKVAVYFSLQQLQNISSLVSPWLDHWQFNLNGSINGGWQNYQWQLQNKQFAINGDGTDKSISVKQIHGSLWPSKVQLDADYQWFPKQNLQMQVNGEIDPSIWSKKYQGNVLVNLSLQASDLASENQHITLNLKQLQGKLQSRAISGSGVIQYFNAKMFWQNWQIKIAQAFMNVNGVLSENSNLNWNINISNLGYWLPNAAGSLISQGDFLGDWHKPRLNASMQLQQIKLFGLTVESLNGKAQLTDLHQQFLFDLQGKGLAYQTQSIDAINLHAAGNTEQHSIQLSIKQALANLSLALMGNYINHDWNGKLQLFDLTPTNSAMWRLQAAVPLNYNNENFTMASPLCLTQAQQTICAKLTWQPMVKALQLNTSTLNLLQWQKFFPNQIHLTTAKAQLNLNLQVDQYWRPLGSAKLQLWPSKATYQIDDNTNFPIELQGLILAKLDNNASLTANLNGNLGEWKANINLPQWRQDTTNWLAQPVVGNVQWKFNNIASLQPLLPQVQNLQANLSMNAQVSGLLNALKVNVDARLQRGQLYLPSINILIKNINLHLQGWLDESLKLMGEFDSTEGRVRLQGTITDLFSLPKITAKFSGNNVLVANLPTYKIWASPQLTMVYQMPNFDLTGDIFIPKASLNFVDYSQSVVSPSSDIVYTDEQHSDFNFSTKLNLKLGDAIDFRYGGLAGTLRGHLLLQQSADANATALGEIHLINGVYKAYGQSLTIQKAEASFKGGDVANPQLNLQAVKVIKNAAPMTADGGIVPGSNIATLPDGSLTVGVSITGPLLQHQVTLFSDPAGLSQSDILSYLILGMPASQAGSGGGQLLLSAASALSDGNNGSVNPITQLQSQLQNTFGLEVGVGQVSQYNASTQSVTQGTALVLTKALSPKLFLSYSAGINQDINVFKVRYQIAKSWSAQTESSSLGNGGDIYYTINRY